MRSIQEDGDENFGCQNKPGILSDMKIVTMSQLIADSDDMDESDVPSLLTKKL